MGLKCLSYDVLSCLQVLSTTTIWRPEQWMLWWRLQGMIELAVFVKRGWKLGSVWQWCLCITNISEWLVFVGFRGSFMTALPISFWNASLQRNNLNFWCWADYWRSFFHHSLLMVTVDIGWKHEIYMKKESIGNHHFIEDWNDILPAYASKIDSHLVGFTQNQIWHPRIKFVCSKKLILDSKEHSWYFKINSWF